LQINLYTADGRKLKTYYSPITAQSAEIQLPQATGIYVIEVRLEDGRLFRKKVLVN
jgi:hypothetical protein